MCFFLMQVYIFKNLTLDLFAKVGTDRIYFEIKYNFNQNHMPNIVDFVT